MLNCQVKRKINLNENLNRWHDLYGKQNRQQNYFFLFKFLKQLISRFTKETTLFI